MIWLAYFTLALESLVIAIGLWMMWAMVSEASRESDDPFSVMQHPQERPLAHSPKHPPVASDDPAPFTLQRVDERGYMSSRKLHMGCEAGVCRIPMGARIVAGGRSLAEPQYAWDYASVEQADKALVYAEFNTTLTRGKASSAWKITGAAPIRQQNPRSTCVGGGTQPTDEWRGSELLSGAPFACVRELHLESMDQCGG
jgi:hypothetical protein